MNNLSQRINALEEIGSYLRNYDSNNFKYYKLNETINKAYHENKWFRNQECIQIIKYWGMALEKNKIQNWISPYNLPQNHKPKTIALILAGNLPMVGFHDLISVWLSGNNALVKCASKDRLLIPFLVNISTLLKEITFFTDKKIEKFDGIIATGSNNSARYFDYYFSKYPSLIRKNRNSVALLNGNETNIELEKLGNDMLQYFGLGCRNVSKIYLPEEFELNRIFGGVYHLSDLIEVNKYANNYDYNKALFLMNEINFLDNGFLILKEDKSISSPVACVHYEFYTELSVVKNELEENNNQIQCLVTNESIDKAVSFGKTQTPELNDYADGIDTIDFLKSL